jgi:hypothetical protein
MRRLNKDGLFSETACRERFNSLTEGTARIPTEMDDDPDARRLELETYRSTREDARNKEQAIKDKKEALERKAKEEAKVKNAQKSEEIAYKRQQAEAEKAQRAIARATAAQVRLQRANENTIAKAAHNAKMKKQEDQVAKRAAARNKGKGKEKAKVAAPKPSKIAAPKASNSNNTLALSNTEITEDTPDPRGYLCIAELQKLCDERGINTFKKGKNQLLNALQDADDEWTAEDLRKLCRSQNLNSSGSKRSMKYHLALATAQGCTSFQTGVAAARADEMDEE